MSGGHYNYQYAHIENLAGDIRATTHLRRLFKNHLRAVAHAAKAIEWVDSDDWSPGAEDQAIKDVVMPDGLLSDAARKELLRVARQDLDEAIERANEAIGFLETDEKEAGHEREYRPRTARRP